MTNLPANLPADTVYLPDLPDGVSGTYYDSDISFRLPRTTTPVHAIDSTTPSGLTISKFEIISIEGLPPGMYWQPNAFNFNLPGETDGCIKICGTPHASDSFKLVVTLKATVLFVPQEATFPMSLYIAPKVSNTDGFSMTDPEGCGNATVSFTNNVPSGGSSGFTYEWDFGDGSAPFTGENPAPHVYDEVGLYTVSYHATVDTVGYILESVKIIDVECVDELGLGSPDLYFEIFAPNNGPKVFDSSPHVNNAPLPYLFPVGIKLGPGNYVLSVTDEDSGLKGSDDDCGTVSFNILSNGTVIAGGLKVELNILHPVEEITAKDTVIVYPQPAPAQLSAPNGTSACATDDGLTLVSSYVIGNQWLLNGSTIPGANDFMYLATETGYYQTQNISQYGCVAISDSLFIELYLPPAAPVWYNYNNSLRLYDTTILPLQYSLQWFNGANIIPGETGLWYCASEAGNYGLLLTDLTTGCNSFYSNLLVYDPAFDCTVGSRDIAKQYIQVQPNPAATTAVLLLPTEGEAGRLQLYDLSGRMLLATDIEAGQKEYLLNVAGLNAGMYGLELVQAGVRHVGKLVVNR